MILAVLFLNGFPRSGKDSLVRALNVVAGEKNIRIAQASTVDRVKDAIERKILVRKESEGSVVECI